VSKLWKGLIPILVALAIWAIPTPSGLEAYAWQYFAIFVGVVVALILEPIPAAAVGLVGVVLCASLMLVPAPEPPKPPAPPKADAAKPAAKKPPKPSDEIKWALAGFSNGTVWLIFIAFMFALGYEKTGLGRRFSLVLIKKLGKRTLGLGYAVALADLCLAPFMPSNTARSGGTIFPIIKNIPGLYGSTPDHEPRKIGGYIMWVALATTCVTSTMFFTGLAPNLLAMSLVEKTIGIKFTWMEWFLSFAPIGFLLFLAVAFIGITGAALRMAQGRSSLPATAVDAEGRPEAKSAAWPPLALLLAALLLFAGSYRRARSPDTRRRLRVALTGTVLGALPFAALVALRNLSPASSVPGERAAVLLTLLVPASFAWATAVHRVFEFRVALRAGVLLVALAVLGVVVYAAGEWLAAAWRRDLGAGLTGGALAFVALVAAVAGPTSRLLRSLGRRFVPDDASATERLDATQALRDGPPARTLEAACAALAGAFHLDGCLALELARGGPRTVAGTGTTAAPPPETDFTASLPEGGGLASVEDLRLRAPDRRALERCGVAWLLPVGGTVRHCLLLGRRLGGSWFGTDDRRELKRFAGHLEVLLDNARLREEAGTRGSFGRELSRAGAIQAHLLPRHVPAFRSLDCAAAALSCEPVGGDYYDFVRSPGRVVTLAVGDAAGKGIPAALMGTWVHAGFRDRARRGSMPGHLLTALNLDLVALNQPDAFVALLCARLDVRGATFTYANAGLTPPLLRRRDGRCEVLAQSGVLLGVTPGARYDDSSVELDAGDIVVLYSDGLTEARRGQDEFGLEGLQRVLEAHARQGAAEILRALLAEVQAFADGPLDDVTVVVLKQLTRPARLAGGGGQEELKLEAGAADTTM